MFDRGRTTEATATLDANIGKSEIPAGRGHFMKGVFGQREPINLRVQEHARGVNQRVKRGRRRFGDPMGDAVGQFRDAGKGPLGGSVLHLAAHFVEYDPDRGDDRVHTEPRGKIP